MAGNLIGEPFKSYVNEQIKARQEVHGKTERNLKEISYLNSRNAWIKMASGVILSAKKYNKVTEGIDTPSLGKNQDDDGGLLAKNWVLFNGLGKQSQRDIENPDGTTTSVDYIKGDRAGISGGNKAYGIGGTKFGYAPMPGIVDASLKCLNRGSIKKMEVNVIAHNTNQFNVIDTLYLRLGYSVFIEWGYDKYWDNNGDLQPMGPSLIDEKFFSGKFKDSNYSRWVPEIEKKREKTDGNYEGIFGTISNFSWTFQDDGSYKIKIEIISLGDIIESLRANLPPIGKIESSYQEVRANKLKQTIFIDDKAASQDDFYDKLYIGLKDVLINFYTNAYNSRSSSQYLKGKFEPDEYSNPLKLFQYQGDNLYYILDLPNFSSQTEYIGTFDDDTKVISKYLQEGIYFSFKKALLRRSDKWINSDRLKGDYLKNQTGTPPNVTEKFYERVEESTQEGFFRPPSNSTSTYIPTGGDVDVLKNGGIVRRSDFFIDGGYVTSVERLLKDFYEFALENNFAGGSADLRFYPTNATIIDRESNKNRITKYFATLRKTNEKLNTLFKFKKPNVFTKIGGKEIPNPKGLIFPTGVKELIIFNKSVNFPKFTSSNFKKYDKSFCYMSGLTGYFIKLGTFLDYLQEFIIPKIDKGNQPMMTIDTNEKNNICYVVDNIISLNPKKIQINNSDFLTYSNGYIEINEGLSPFKQKEGKYIYGNIMNIYFSFDRIEEIFDDIDSDGNISIYNVIKKICQDINETLGFINNIEPVISDTNEKGKVIGNVIKLIDQTPIPGIEIISKQLGFETPDKEAILEVFGYNQQYRDEDNKLIDRNPNEYTSTFVNKIGITTEINKKYATMITIGATSQGSIPGVEATSFSKWNEGITDRFKNKLVDAVATTKKTDPLENIIEQNKNVYGEYTEYLKQQEGLFGYNVGEEGSVNDKIVSTNSKVASNFYKYQASYSSLKNSDKDGAISSVGFMPFNLKLDMDGLGGIKIYNRLQVNTSFLPPNYGNSLQFIVTGVNHKIKDNSWTTHLDTLATSKPQATPEILVPTEKLIETNPPPDYSLIIASCPTTVVSGWEVPATFNGTTLNTTIKRKNVTPNASVKRDIVPIINGSDYKSKYTLGHRILAMVTVLKEGYNEIYSDNPLGTKAYRTKNPGNIGNTDSGKEKTLSSVKEGMELVMEYYSKRNKGTGFTKSLKIWNFGPQKLSPKFSEEIQENLANYGNPPNGCLPGYEGNYQGEISYFVKRYSTASRINNSGLSRFKTLFELNGYTNFTTSSKIQDLMAFGGISNQDIKFS